MIFKDFLKKVFLKIWRFPRHLYTEIFGLKGFHKSTYLEKKYCALIVKHLNSRTLKNSVLEIGTGLGDILLNLNFKFLNGYDHKKNVLEALKFRNKIYFFKRKNLITKLYSIHSDEQIKGKFDVIIICNFIHNFEPKLINQKIKDFYKNNLSKGGEIIFDSLETEEPLDLNQKRHYKYTHSPSEIKEITGGEIQILGQFTINNSNFRRKIISLKESS